MQFPYKLLSFISIIYCNKCFENLNIDNQTLYSQVIDYFFLNGLNGLRNSETQISHYLCKLSNQICCSCEKVCRYYGTCSLDAFFNGNISSSESYINAFLKMNEIQKYVRTLPVITINNKPFRFIIKEVPMVYSCDKESIYKDLCKWNDSGVYERIIANDFIYKNKYCALCHGFETYIPAKLELVGCNNLANISGILLTVPDESCTLDIVEVDGFRCDEEKSKICNKIRGMSEMKSESVFSNLCNHSSKGWYPKPTHLPECFQHSSPPLKSHFRLLISFDKDGNSNSKLITGNPICPCDQYFDISSSQCKKTLHHVCKKINSNIGSFKGHAWIKRYSHFENLISLSILV